MTLADAQARTLAYVREPRARAGTAPLCGNSIGIDRRFLDRYMHDLDTLPALPQRRRVVVEGAVPALVSRRSTRKRPGKSEQHRALDDIRESIEELRFYREQAVHPAGARPRRSLRCRASVADVMSATAGSATTTPSCPESLAR